MIWNQVDSGKHLTMRKSHFVETEKMSYGLGSLHFTGMIVGVIDPPND